ncbi:MAG: hypothetical protein LBD24_02430 [Spirochaetaceae bacterium]|nr:hypothetical protein [Spirochaetaceae bacterium]
MRSFPPSSLKFIVYSINLIIHLPPPPCQQPEAAPRPSLRTTTHGSRSAGGCAKRSRAWAVQARSPDRVLHHSETTGGHAVPPAPPADRVLHRSETTGGHAVPPAAGGLVRRESRCRCRSRGLRRMCTAG